MRSVDLSLLLYLPATRSLINDTVPTLIGIIDVHLVFTVHQYGSLYFSGDAD